MSARHDLGQTFMDAILSVTEDLPDDLGAGIDEALRRLTPDLFLALAIESGALTERSALTDGNTPRKHHRFFVATEAL